MAAADLEKHLAEYGYLDDDAKAIAEAFFARGFQAAVKVIDGYNTTEHDYEDELLWVLVKWHDLAK